MSTSLVVPDQNTALANAGDVPALQGVGISFKNLKPTILALNQRSTRAKGTVPGLFREKENPSETYSEIKVVFLREAREGRVMFPKGSDLGAAPLCRSRDGLVPVTDDDRLEPQAPACAKCPMADWSKWQKNKIKENIPPCSNNLNLLFVDRDIKWPYSIQIDGKSISQKLPKGYEKVIHWPKLLQELAKKSAKAKLQFGFMPNIFDFTMTMYAEEIEGNNGTYFVVAFKDIKLIGEKDRPEFHDIFSSYQKQQQKVEAAASGEKDEDEDDGLEEEQSVGHSPVQTQAPADAPDQEYEV